MDDGQLPAKSAERGTVQRDHPAFDKRVAPVDANGYGWGGTAAGDEAENGRDDGKEGASLRNDWRTTQSEAG